MNVFKVNRKLEKLAPWFVGFTVVAHAGLAGLNLALNIPPLVALNGLFAAGFGVVLFRAIKKERDNRKKEAKALVYFQDIMEMIAKGILVPSKPSVGSEGQVSVRLHRAALLSDDQRATLKAEHWVDECAFELWTDKEPLEADILQVKSPVYGEELKAMTLTTVSNGGYFYGPEAEPMKQWLHTLTTKDRAPEPKAVARLADIKNDDGFVAITEALK